MQGVQAQIMLPLDPSTSQFMTVTQELVLGMDLSVPMPNRHYRTLPVRSGRFLAARAITRWRSSARRSPPRAGSRSASHITLEDEDYEVVGVLDRMLTAPDRFVIVSRSPTPAPSGSPRTGSCGPCWPRAAWRSPRPISNTGAAVGWRDGDDPDAVALRIKERVPGVNVQLPSELLRLLRSSTAFFSALLVGIGALAFVIGGLSLANTMAAAVFERIRDFGVKRALGATDLQLGREVLGRIARGHDGRRAWPASAWRAGSAGSSTASSRRPSSSSISRRASSSAPSCSRSCCGAAAAIYATTRVVSLSPAEAIRRGA